MIVTTGVITTQYCRSFQSMKKSQSPASSKKPMCETDMMRNAATITIRASNVLDHFAIFGDISATSSTAWSFTVIKYPFLCTFSQFVHHFSVDFYFKFHNAVVCTLDYSCMLTPVCLKIPKSADALLFHATAFKLSAALISLKSSDMRITTCNSTPPSAKPVQPRTVNPQCNG